MVAFHRSALVLAAVLVAGLLAGCASSEGDVTGSIAGQSAILATLQEAKLQYREGNFGKAIAAYTETVEKDAGNAEGWLGLAASYDQVRRFDLADKAYQRVTALIGDTAPVLNNLGYSYYLRGDLEGARRKLAAAQELDPENTKIANNIALLNEKLGVEYAAPVALLDEEAK